MGRYFLATAGLILLALCLTTVRRNGLYANELALYRDTAKKSPVKTRVLNNLGETLRRAGRPREAAVYLERALAIQPDYADAMNNLAAAYNSMGRRDDATDLLLSALEISSDHIQARTNLALYYYQAGLVPEAAEQFQLITEIAPAGHEADFARAMLRMIQAKGQRQ